MKYLYVYYKGYSSTLDDKADKIMQTFGAMPTGSGFGFGQRDISYEIDEFAIPKAVRLLKKAGFKTEVVDID